MHRSIEIRSAGMSDLNAVNDLFRDERANEERYADIFVPQSEPPRSREWLETCVESDRELLLLAFLGDRLVGLLRGAISQQNQPWMVQRTIGEIISVLVAEPFRNRGIGTLLIDEIEQWFASQGVEETRLTVMAHNIAAERLYERLGYRRFRSEMRKYPLRPV